jgi:hypothetical protein
MRRQTLLDLTDVDVDLAGISGGNPAAARAECVLAFHHLVQWPSHLCFADNSRRVVDIFHFFSLILCFVPLGGADQLGPSHWLFYYIFRSGYS